tara:strand:+ start:182 stop:331 length:150 start_codon:yes stop_codon:yes gene_type:complete
MIKVNKKYEGIFKNNFTQEQLQMIKKNSKKHFDEYFVEIKPKKNDTVEG